MSTTILDLDKKLLECVGDYLSHPVTTAIAANTSIVSTHLQNYRSTADYFNDKWIYFDDKANLGVSRLISDDDGTSTLTVLGANLTTDGSNLATFRLSRFPFIRRLKALNLALEEVCPNLYIPLDNRDLITNNLLPPFRWSSTSALDLYTASNATLTQTTTGGLYWNGSSSAKVTVSVANGYLGLSSIAYPRLLNLMGRTASLKCWVYPEVANDAWIRIYTLKADGTTQTLTSTTTCPAGKQTLLKLEDQSINDDLVQLDIRMGVTTINKYTYFSMPRINGVDLNEYILPNDFDSGKINQVFVQSSGYAEDWCDDLRNDEWSEVFGWSIIDDGNYKYLRLPTYGGWYQVRLLGSKIFDSVDDGADTVNLESINLNLLIEYAAYKLFDLSSQGTSGEDRSNYERQAMKHLAYYERLRRTHAMPQKPLSLNIAPIR